MPSAALRRRAGAEGAGDSTVADPTEPVKAEKKPNRSVEQTHKILRPDVLEFPMPTRGDAKLVVPTVFTIGDVVQRAVLDDWDAFSRLVMIELGKVSSIDLAGNPALAFSDSNLPYLSIALSTSNVKDFLRRVLSKSAYVLAIVDGKEQRLQPTAADFDSLGTLDVLAISSNYFGRWIEAVLSKNRPRVESAAT